jgi:hypothetical protein
VTGGVILTSPAAKDFFFFWFSASRQGLPVGASTGSGRQPFAGRGNLLSSATVKSYAVYQVPNQRR